MGGNTRHTLFTRFRWVKLFNQHDLYTKRDTLYSAAELAEMKAYYSTLVDKYLPAQLDF